MDLDTMQTKLETAAISVQNSSAQVGKINSMINGIDSRGRFSQEEINVEKSILKTDLANIIKELESVRNAIE